MYRRAYTLLVGTAVFIFLCAYGVAMWHDRPLVEPEGKLLGPSLTMLLEWLDAMPTSITLSSIVLLIDMFIRAFSILAAALLVEAVAQLIERKPVKIATVGLANKTARIAWAVMARKEVYAAAAA